MCSENLEVRLRWRETGQRDQPVRIHADPNDLPQLMRHLETLARAWGNHDASTRWLGEYEMEVRSLDRPWVDAFTLSGISEDS
ncbi:hypothetical protein SAMN05421678_106278 [Actinopolymorpha cephalotaxi]|uniref:Uncharacterized protein n=1 Tax=Actinopolymorpha cephalotaxi TaxID=504797 RepID=A0A1I2SLQ8_9ACTN|nr:hypothetical protein [Actinopolymorpha cephalotaxi]SFG53845.1 hypothetical protein SAMN05421678_106278 [Actinopolymorpha cephalotaxi]